MRATGLLLLVIAVLVAGCGGKTQVIEQVWQPVYGGGSAGEIRVLMPLRSTETDIRRMAEQLLTEARKTQTVTSLKIDFTDSVIYYGARYNLARVEFTPKRGTDDQAPIEAGGLAAHWSFRGKVLNPDKPRPTDSEIRYYGLVFKTHLNAKLQPDEDAWLKQFRSKHDQAELEEIYLRVQSWLFD